MMRDEKAIIIGELAFWHRLMTWKIKKEFIHDISHNKKRDSGKYFKFAFYAIDVFNYPAICY